VTTTNDKMLATMRRPVPWQRVRRCALVAVADLLAGCTDPPPRTGEVGDALIYGDDTRRDVYAAGGLGRIALQSTIAFVSPEHLMRDPAGPSRSLPTRLAPPTICVRGRLSSRSPPLRLARACSSTNSL